MNGCQIFGWFGYFKTEFEPIFGFPHTPTCNIHTWPIRMSLGGFTMRCCLSSFWGKWHQMHTLT